LKYFTLLAAWPQGFLLSELDEGDEREQPQRKAMTP
jgi:hypothetical protein